MHRVNVVFCLVRVFGGEISLNNICSVPSWHHCDDYQGMCKLSLQKKWTINLLVVNLL